MLTMLFFYHIMRAYYIIKKVMEAHYSLLHLTHGAQGFKAHGYQGFNFVRCGTHNMLGLGDDIFYLKKITW